MNKTLAEDEESLNDFKHALISLCCAIIPFVGIFFFIMKDGTLEKAFMMYVLDFAKEQYRVSNVLMDQNEMSFVASFALRQQIKKIEKTLGEHGITIEKLLGYDDVFKWADDYIKRSWGDKESE